MGMAAIGPARSEACLKVLEWRLNDAGAGEVDRAGADRCADRDNHDIPDRTPPMKPDHDPPEPGGSTYKSRGGLARIWRAGGYSLAGLQAALRHEAAFRQELALGLPLALLACWLAPGRWQLLAMVGSIVLVWIVELLNSALEALADAQTTEHHPLLGRAKDLGSAAVLFALLLVVLSWGVALWP
jgi:diacylglycerol kinase (ATP)